MVQRTISSQKSNIDVEDILPYLKNGKFYEEKEMRLVFSNIKQKTFFLALISSLH